MSPLQRLRSDLRQAHGSVVGLDRAFGKKVVVESAPDFDPMTLSPLQQAALLMMTESHVKRALIARVLEECQDKPTLADFAILRDFGLAKWKAGKQQHDITGPGIVASVALVKALCKKFNIHLMIEGNRHGWKAFFHCPCGEWSLSTRASHTAQGWANQSFARHVDSAEGARKLFVALKPPAQERA